MPLPALALAAAATAAIAAAPAADRLPPLDEKRVHAIAAMLPAEPTGPGHPITDRAFWDGLAARDKAYAGAVARAEKIIATPLPPYPRDAYLDYSRNGNRTRYQDAEGLRRNRLGPLVLAECIENKGRFLPAIAELIDALCDEPAWVLPAHDPKLDDFEGRSVDIELASSALAADFGATDYLLGGKLPAATRANLRANVRRRILVPFLDMIDGKRAPNWWIKGTNNWNAVCLDGVVGAALYESPSREERARFVAAGERYIQNFLSGFTKDGYCGEGLGYWNYGFGNFYKLSEAVRQATGGKVDLLADPGARMPALFAVRIQIMNGISPAFADCGVFAKPDAALMHMLDRRFALGLPQYAAFKPVLAGPYETMIYATGDDAPGVSDARQLVEAGVGLPSRDFFDAAGILVCRPGRGGTAKLGAALKGGSNNESHNHNDVGSYVVVVGDRPVLLDPGPETYTARTFSAHRYDSKLLNSFGHPVPVIGGVLQHEGADAVGKVVQTDFSPQKDTFTLDIASAYRVPDLRKLTRTWVYSRTGDGALTVTDKVTLEHPQTFGTAFLTLGDWHKQPDGSLLVEDGDSAVTVRIDTGGKPYTLHPYVIREDAPVAPTRVGIDLDQPVTDAVVTLTITPVTLAAEKSADGNLLRNGGFERGAYGWTLGPASMGEVSTGRAAPGGTSLLRIHDDDATRGSNVVSSRGDVPAGTTKVTLRGTANFASGGGIGLYVHFYDAAGDLLTPRDADSGNETPAGVLAGGEAAKDKWTPFSFPVAVPAGSARFDVLIHSFNAAKCDAYLDDLEVVP